MMIDLDELKRLAGLVTPGPLMAEEDPCDGRDYKVLVTTKGTRTFRGTWVMRAEHNWTDADYSERRISWKEAEANAAATALLLSNLPNIIAALEAGQQDWPKPIDDRAATAVIAREFEALEAENARLREALEAEDAYWAASRAHACALPRLSEQSGFVFQAARDRRDAARAALGASHDADA